MIGVQNTNITARTSMSPFGTAKGRGGGGAAFELLDEDIEERFVKASVPKPVVCVPLLRVCDPS